VAPFAVSATVFPGQIPLLAEAVFAILKEGTPLFTKTVYVVEALQLRELVPATV
jgi:hypothetical protein